MLWIVLRQNGFGHLRKIRIGVFGGSWFRAWVRLHPLDQSDEFGSQFHIFPPRKSNDPSG
ncbi:hypothetical protein MesoLjLb_31170 [Mesorhizobium sp. L-8-3]|nr:hypothetical protein MesoLjLb_31170 [Mesorhizobium sp. L-8-3]